MKDPECPVQTPWSLLGESRQHFTVIQELLMWTSSRCGWSLIVLEPKGPSLCWVEPRLGEREVGVPRLLAWGSSFKIRCYIDGPLLVLLPQTLPILGGPACVGVFLKVENNLCLEKSNFDYLKFSCLDIYPMSWPEAINFLKPWHLSCLSYSDNVFILAAAIWLQLACPESRPSARAQVI